MVSVLLAIAAVAAFWISRRAFGNLLTPFSVFYGAWFTSLFLWSLNWIDYLTIRTSTWLILGGSMVAFGIGWFAAWTTASLPASSSAPCGLTETVSADRLRRTIEIFFIIGMIGLADFLWQVNGSMGLGTYVEAPHEIRQAMALGGTVVERLQPFNWLNVANVGLCSLYLWVFKAPKKWQIGLILGLSLIATVLMEDRTRFFYAVLWALFMLAQARAWKRKTVIIGLLATVGFLLVQFFAVALWLGKIAENNPILANASRLDESMLPLLTAYIYLTGSFPAFQAYLDSAPVTTHGSMTFYPLFKAIHLIDPTLKAPAIVADPVYIPSEFNVFTWLHQFYTDFGVAGAILGPLVVGLVCGLVYCHIRRHGSFFSIYLNGLLCFALSLSFMVNHLTQGPMWYFIGVGLIVSRYIGRPVPVRKIAEATA